MKTKTQLSDFRFEFAGHGHYKVTYESPVTGKRWCYTTNDMTLIDCTKNADYPKRNDLDALKWNCKIKGAITKFHPVPRSIRNYDF